MQQQMALKLFLKMYYTVKLEPNKESSGSVCSLSVPDEVLANFSAMGVLGACALMN
jgi:hypothetical protein